MIPVGLQDSEQETTFPRGRGGGMPCDPRHGPTGITFHPAERHDHPAACTFLSTWTVLACGPSFPASSWNRTGSPISRRSKSAFRTLFRWNRNPATTTRRHPVHISLVNLQQPFFSETGRPTICLASQEPFDRQPATPKACFPNKLFNR